MKGPHPAATAHKNKTKQNAFKRIYKKRKYVFLYQIIEYVCLPTSTCCTIRRVISFLLELECIMFDIKLNRNFTHILTITSTSTKYLKVDRCQLFINNIQKPTVRTQVQRLCKHLNTIRTYKPNKHRQIFEHRDCLCIVTFQRSFAARANFYSIVFVLELIKSTIGSRVCCFLFGDIKKLVN